MWLPLRRKRLKPGTERRASSRVTVGVARRVSPESTVTEKGISAGSDGAREALTTIIGKVTWAAAVRADRIVIKGSRAERIAGGQSAGGPERCKFQYACIGQSLVSRRCPLAGNLALHMANWEYKVISSGKGGFASPALMEKFINDLGQDNWEIISFHQPPDNALAFTGLARRTTQRDWTLEDAAKAAARAEADKLRAEFEAKFKAASGVPQPATAEEQAATFLAEEKLGAEGSIRRLRDTSRDDDPDASEDENGAPPKNEWDKLASEDELPTFFDALRPHMRRNQRGPGMSVGTDFLAKKWRLEESDIKTALVECGMQIPADENAKPVYVEYEGELYWVNINRRGEIWINLREKPEPVFRIVQGKRLTEEEPR